MKSIFVLILVALLFFAGIVSAPMNVFIPNHLSPGGTLVLSGNVTNSSGSGVSNVNVSVSGAGLTVSNTTDENGTIYMSGTVTSTNGMYTLSISSNYTSETKPIPIFITPVANTTFTYVNDPPYSAGGSILLNLTLINSSGSAVVGYKPEVRVFSDGGINVNSASTVWNITNLSNETSASGIIAYNLSIPSSASGPYMVFVDGVSFSVFNVFSDYKLIPGSYDNTTGTASSSFYISSGITLKVVARDSSNDAVSNATITGKIIDPSGDVTTFTMSETSTEGVYEYNLSNTSESGTYVGEFSGEIEGSNVQSSISFTVGGYDAELVPATDEDFFFEMGGKSGFKPGQQAKYLFMFGNRSSKELFAVSANGAGGTVNCSAIQLVNFVASNGTSYNSSVASTFGNGVGTLFGESVCYVNFTAPSSSSNYRFTAKISLNGTSSEATTIVPISRYSLVVTPLANVEGEVQDKFSQMFEPGSNVTFQIRAYDMNGSEISGSGINLVSAQSMFHLPSGTTLQNGSGFTIVSQSDSTDRVVVTLPTAYTDAFLLKVSANISNENVTGEAFFFSKYIVGFLGLMTEGFFGGGPGSSATNFGFNGLYCSGNHTFSGNLMLAGTSEQASGISIYSDLIELRNELNGKDYTNCMTFASNSSVNGSITTVARFNSSCSLPGGNYFGFVNVSYTDPATSQISYDQIPTFFDCSTVDALTNIKGAGSSSQSVSAGEALQVNISGAKLLSTGNVVNGTVVVHHMESFGESFGPPEFKTPSANLTFTLTNGNALFNISPSNFSLSSWRKGQGFVEFTFTVCSASGSCDSERSGVMIQSSSGLRVWPLQWPSTQFVPNTALVLDMAVTSNVSSASAGADNTQNITAFFKSYGVWSSVAAIVNSTKISDGWNSSADSGYERWQVNITIPSTLQFGGSDLELKITNYAGETVSMHFGGSIQGASVGISEAELRLDDLLIENFDNATLLAAGWNMTWIAQNFSWGSYSPASEVCIANNVTAISWGSGGQSSALASSELKTLVVDSNNDGIYDNLLLRNSSLSADNATNRSAFFQINSSSRKLNGTNYYLWQIYDCDFAKLVPSNASSSSLFNWLGQYGVNSNMSVPLIITRGTSGVSGVTMNITKIYLESDQGFGVTSQLSPSNWTFTTATTNSDGIVFLTGNISSPGRYKLVWSVNGSLNDTATFESMLHIEVRAFQVMSDGIYTTGNYTVNLTNTSQSGWDMFGSNASIFNGTSSNFLNLGVPFRIALNATNNATKLQYSSDGGSTWTNNSFNDETFLNSSEFEFTGALSGKFLRVSSFNNAGSTKQVTFYQSQPMRFMFQPTSATEQATVAICVRNFDIPAPLSLSGANISSITFRQWSSEGSGGPTDTVLTFYNPITGNSAVGAGVLTGPSGCAYIKADAPTSWTGKQGEIRANVSYGGLTENVHVLEVFGGFQ